MSGRGYDWRPGRVLWRHGHGHADRRWNDGPTRPLPGTATNQGQSACPLQRSSVEDLATSPGVSFF